MSLTIKQGSTDQSVYFTLIDVTDGTPMTGLVHNTAGLKAYYTLNRAAAVQITLATLTNPDSAHTDGGFKEVSASNAPGVYRLDLPDAALASGSAVIVTISGAADLKAESKEISLVAYDPQSATSLGLTNLDAAITSRMATYTQPTGFLDATFPDGTIANTTNITGGTITTATNLTNLPTIPTNWLTADGLASDAVAEIQAGLATAADLAVVDGNVDDIKAVTDKLDTMLVLDDTVYQFTANALELGPAGEGGGGGATAEQIWTYAARTLTAGTNIVLEKGTGVTGFNDLSAAQVNAEVDTALSDVGLTTTVTDRIDEAISTRLPSSSYSAPPSASQNATAVRAELETELGRIDVGISTRLAGASYVVPDNAGITSLQSSVDDIPTNAELATALSGLATASAVAALPTAAQNAAAVLNTQMVESYAAAGVAPTLAQSVQLVQQRMTDFSIAGTTISIKRLDGNTNAATLTINDDTAPTSSTRAT